MCGIDKVGVSVRHKNEQNYAIFRKIDELKINMLHSEELGSER